MAISTSTGLISGIDYKTLITQLMEIEARPLTRMQTRVDTLNEQKSAFLELSARLLSMKLGVATLSSSDAFARRTASSSNTGALVATAARGTAVGNYTFVVQRLVQTQQMVSNGFPDTNNTRVGAGTIRFEPGGFVDKSTRLEELNGQAGIDRGSIRITDRSGSTATIDLSAAATVNDVLDAINYADGISVRAWVEGDHLVLEDTSGSTAASLRVQDLGGHSTAADLGLAGTAAGRVLTGTSVLALNASMTLDSLNGGTGVRTSGGTDFMIQTRDGTTLAISLAGKRTVGEVIDAINSHASNTGKVTARIAERGGGLTLIDHTEGAGVFQVTDPGGTHTAADLGIEGADDDGDGVLAGQRLLAGLNTVSLRSLRGGSGITRLGAIRITDRTGSTATIDLSGARDLADVLRAINSAGLSVTARINAARNGIELVDTSGGTASHFIVADVDDSTVAADLGLTHDAADTLAASGDLDVNWINRGTRLDQLNGGRGIFRGRFKITTASGQSATVDLSQGNETTIGHVIDEINTRGLNITARINDTGDGILIEDHTSGPLKLKITEVDGTTAADLNLLKEDTDGDGVIDGSFERSVEIGATATLEDVRKALNDMGAPIRANIITDGSGVNRYRLVIASKHSGSAGEFLLDPGATGLSFTTLTPARDAAVTFGENAPGSRTLYVTSSTNTIANIVPGLTLDLKSAGTGPVTVSVAQDVDAIVSTVGRFVEAYNGIRDKIAELTSFNPDTLDKGLLFGDPTVRQIDSALSRVATAVYSASPGQLRVIAELGLTIDSAGKLSFNEQKLRDQLAANVDKVQAFFATAGTGFADQVKAMVDSLTDASGGVIITTSEHIDDKVADYKARMERLSQSLTAKSEKLYRQFSALETALARLQAQQSYLSQIQLITMPSSNKK